MPRRVEHVLDQTLTVSGGYRSRCKCGWKSRVLKLKDAAEDSLHVHKMLNTVGKTPEQLERQKPRDPNKFAVMISMTDDLHGRLMDRCETEQRSKSEVMRDALRLYLAQRRGLTASAPRSFTRKQ